MKWCVAGLMVGLLVISGRARLLRAGIRCTSGEATMRTLLLLGLCAVLGCGSEPGTLDSCLSPDIGHVDAHGQPDPCFTHGDDVTCPGDCVPLGTVDFRREAVLLWMGDPAKVPACPERALSV